MSGRPSSSSSPWPSGSPGPRSSSRSLAASLGIFLLKLAILVPALFYVWGFVQPGYSAMVAGATDILIGAEEAGGRVTTLRPAGARIEVWSSLRDDGLPANSYNADLLHFYIVLCLALALAFPRPRGMERLLVLTAIFAALFLFHAIALLVTVENTYANALVEIARRNYSPAESLVYRWLYQTFAYLAIQLLPAAVLALLFVRYGGIGGGMAVLRGAPPPVDGDTQATPPVLRKSPSRIAAWALAAGALAALAAGSVIHIGKVRARRAEDLCVRGFKTLLAGSPEAASSQFAGAIALKPAFLEAHDGEGSALLALGRSDLAMDAYLDALKIDPRYFASRLGLANSLVSLGRLDEAIAEFEKAADLSPDRWEPHYNRAVLLLRKKRTADAEAGFRRAVELNPSMPDARFELAKILINTKRLCEALPHLEAYLSLEPASQHAALIQNTLEAGRKACAGR